MKKFYNLWAGTRVKITHTMLISGALWKAGIYARSAGAHQ